MLRSSCGLALQSEEEREFNKFLHGTNFYMSKEATAILRKHLDPEYAILEELEKPDSPYDYVVCQVRARAPPAPATPAGPR